MPTTRTTKNAALSPVLAHSTLTEAHEALLALDNGYDLIPECARPEIHEALDRLLAAAAEHDICTLRQVIDGQKQILATATGVAMRSQPGYLDDNGADMMHLHRNLLVTLCLAGVMDYNGDLAQVTNAFPPLKERTSHQIRHYTDDEAILLRLWVLRMSTGTKTNQRSAAVYAQTDAGLSMTETTRTRTDDADLTPGNALIYAPGHHGGIAPRILPLEAFHTHVIGQYLTNRGPTDDDLLTFRARKVFDTPAEAAVSAAASASGVIDRIRNAVGLKHLDTTPASIAMWRIVTIMRTDGPNAALTASGRSNLANLNEVLWHGTRGQTLPLETNRKKRTLNFDAA